MSRSREYREGWTGRRRTYTCRVCRTKFQHDGGELLEKSRICPECREDPVNQATFDEAFAERDRAEILTCPLCKDGVEKPAYREPGLRHHLSGFHRRLDVNTLVELAKTIKTKEVGNGITD